MDSRHIFRILWVIGIACLAQTPPARSTPADTASAPAGAGDSLAVAADTARTALAEPAGAEFSYFALMVKLGLGLGLVVLLAWGTVFLLRKSAFGQQFSGTGSTVKVVERTYLGPKKAIYLVQIGDRTLALGVTEATISPLGQWQTGELDLTPRRAASSSFSAQFRHLLGHRPPDRPAQEG